MNYSCDECCNQIDSNIEILNPEHYSFCNSCGGLLKNNLSPHKSEIDILFNTHPKFKLQVEQYQNSLRKVMQRA